MRLLILGGTGFLGPHVVQAAIDRGHTMTLFNRGKTNPHLFPDLEKLVGDRYDDLSALDRRSWDGVIDTFAYVPAVARASAELLRDAVDQYVLISSVSAYADFSQPLIDEDSPVGRIDQETIDKFKRHSDPGFFEHYGPFKALCEEAAEAAMPGRVTNIRPGLIVGPGDPSGRFTYWPVRVAEGGEVLAPESPEELIQHIDVRDLAEWIITCLEQGTVGVLNAVTPPGAHTMGELVETCRSVSDSGATITWVDAAFLEEQEVRPWMDLPVWVPAVGEYLGFSRTSAARARTAGLRYRPMTVTVRDTLDWYREQPEDKRPRLRGGMPREREQEVLAAWHAAAGMNSR